MQQDNIRRNAMTGGLVLMVFMSAVCSGFLVVFQFKPDLVIELDVLKLILLGSALTLPLFMFTTYVSFVVARARDAGIMGHLLMGSMLTFATIYGPLMLSYVFHLSFRAFVVMILALQALLGLIALGAVRMRPQPPAGVKPGGTQRDVAGDA
jgi:hypothetical protein